MYKIENSFEKLFRNKRIVISNVEIKRMEVEF